jgi:acyl carrier protein
MNDTEKLELICRALVEVKGKPLTVDITPETKMADAGLDSLDSIELQMWIEEHLGIEIPEPAAAPVTFGDLMSLL